jgi:hypothetical protein
LIRDEIYLQVIRQTTNNPKLASLLRGCMLMALCCGCFPPGAWFCRYLSVHLQQMKLVQADKQVSASLYISLYISISLYLSRVLPLFLSISFFHFLLNCQPSFVSSFLISSQVKQYVSQSEKRLAATIKFGPRAYVPLQKEVEWTEAQKPISVQVFLEDGRTQHNVLMDMQSTSTDMIQIMYSMLDIPLDQVGSISRSLMSTIPCLSISLAFVKQHLHLLPNTSSVFLRYSTHSDKSRRHGARRL